MIYFFLLVIALLGAGALWIQVGGRRIDPLAAFRAELRDLDTDLEAGRINAADHASVKLEIERRILRAEEPVAKGNRESASISLWPFAALITIGTLGLYAIFGHPQLPGQSGVWVTRGAEVIAPGGPTFQESLDKIRTHLATTPDDRQGWTYLAQVAEVVGDHQARAQAGRALARLNPDDAQGRIMEFEALRSLGGGTITPAAKLVLAAMVREHDGHPAVTYYRGKLAAEMGNEAEARRLWQVLLDHSAPNAPWLPMVRRDLALLDKNNGLPRLSEDQIQSVAGMNAEDRRAFIGQMMSRLRARLDSEPNDPQGWIMLARSQAQMGEKDAAIATLTTALDKVSPENRPIIAAALDKLRQGTDF